MPKFKWETEFRETELGKIPSIWAVKKIGEVADVSTGGTPSRQIKSYWNGDVNWLRSQEVNYEYIYSAEEKITELGRKNSNAKNLLPTGTVVVALIGGTTGKVAMLRIDSTINQNLAAIQGRPNLANNQFVFFYLKMSRERLLQSVYGGAQANLNLDLVREVILPVPESTEQSRIASVLSWFDDQIQNLKKQNELLEKTARALFENWFVDFEPFMDREQVSDELGKIPRNWKVMRIKDVGEVGGGSTPSTKINEYWDGEISWITPRDLALRYSDNFAYISHGERNVTKRAVEECSLRLFPPGTLLLTSRAPIGYVAIADGPVATNQGFKNIVPNDPIYQEFIYCFLKRSVDYLRDIAGGSTFSELTGETLREVELVIPPTHVLESFHQAANPLFRKSLANQRQIICLRKVRDTLLPLLVFGKLRVEEI